MENINRPAKAHDYYAPFAGLALASLSSGYFTTFTAVYLAMLSGYPLSIGMTQSAYYFGMLIGALITEKQISKIGHIRAFGVYITLATAFILALVFFKSHVLMWMLSRFVLGYSLSGIYVIVEGWLLGLSDRSNRGTILTLYTTVLYGFSSLGQFIIDWVDKKNDHPFIVVALIWCLSILPIFLNNKKIPPIIHAPKLKIKEIFANEPISNIGCLVSGLTLSVLYSYAPGYAEIENIDIPTMMFALVIGGTILPILFGRLSDLIDRRVIIIVISLLAIPIFLSFKLWFVHPNLRLIFNFIIGGCLFAIYPICISHIIDNTKEEYVLPATAVAILFYGIGATIGPMLFASIAAISSVKIFYPFMACFSAGLMLLMLKAVFFAPKKVG
jgi:MFS family permease